MRTEGTREHLVFLWTPAGYSLEARPGEPPPRGTAVAEGDRDHRVTKVAPSPLPGDARTCAYLLPGDLSGDEQPHEESHTNGASEPSAPPAPHLTLVAAPPDAEPPAPEQDRATAAEDFLALLGELPEGTSVVTVDAQGRRVGLTIGTLVPLSVDPPLVGFTVPSDELLARLIPVAGGCAITILAGGQEWLATFFETSERPIAMWHGLGAEPGAAGAPLFVGALGWLECVLAETVDLGSHTLFVCEVREAEASIEAPALARVRGRFEAV
jgi:flavin reductase (DIM6/NTAB) family NADH-FMN oxidoreductase RutF